MHVERELAAGVTCPESALLGRRRFGVLRLPRTILLCFFLSRENSVRLLPMPSKVISSVREILHTLLAEGPQPTARALKEVSGSRVSAPTVRKWAGVRHPAERTEEPAWLEEARLVVIDESGYRLGPGLGLMLAFSVGGEHLGAALVDAAGAVHCHARVAPEPHQLQREPEIFLERLRALAVRVLNEGLQRPDLCTPEGPGSVALRLIGATVAWPIPMDRMTQPRASALAASWHSRTMREHLSDALGLPVSRCHAINDANAGALNVAFDQGTDGGVGSVMCMLVAAGIGVGTVHQAIRGPNRLPFIEAHLISGRSGIAGELGHRAVDKSLIAELNDGIKGRRHALAPLDAGRQCECGAGMGHIDAVFGAEAVLARLQRYEEGESLVERLRALHRDADRDIRIRNALNHVGQGLARALDNPVAVIDPSVIKVVGALASKHLISGMTERCSRGDLNPDVSIEMYDEAFNSVVGLRGAALAVLRAALYRGFFDQPTFEPQGRKGWSWQRWSGWDHQHRTGAQTGAALGGKAWKYHPLKVDDTFITTLEAHRHPRGR